MTKNIIRKEIEDKISAELQLKKISRIDAIMLRTVADYLVSGEILYHSTASGQCYISTLQLHNEQQAAFFVEFLESVSDKTTRDIDAYSLEL